MGFPRKVGGTVTLTTVAHLSRLLNTLLRDWRRKDMEKIYQDSPFYRVYRPNLGLLPALLTALRQFSQNTIYLTN